MAYTYILTLMYFIRPRQSTPYLLALYLIRIIRLTISNLFKFDVFDGYRQRFCFFMNLHIRQSVMGLSHVLTRRALMN